MPIMPGMGLQRNVIHFDPLFFILMIYAGLSLTLIATIFQNNPVIVGKATTILSLDAVGGIFFLFMAWLRRIQGRWGGFALLIKGHVALFALVALGATWLSQYIIFVGVGARLGIVDMLQSKMFYSSVGFFEEMFFGLALFLGLNAMLGNNIIFNHLNVLLVALIFMIYHVAVFPEISQLLMVFVPRIIFNLMYLYYPVPSVIALTHVSWNFWIS